MNKVQERIYVEKAADHLNLAWEIGQDREIPDFLISEGNHQFGLEVTEIFVGKEEKGSESKSRESKIQKTIDSYRRKYEAKRKDLLKVNISGIVSKDLIVVNDEVVIKDGVVIKEKMEKLLDILLKQPFDSMEIGQKVKFSLGGRSRASVTKSYSSRWNSLDYKIGFVNHRPEHAIENRIVEKSKRLEAYINNVGSDVRLLIVANCLNNSGKLQFAEQNEKPNFSTRGFNAVYFLSYPDSTIELNAEPTQIKISDGG